MAPLPILICDAIVLLVVLIFPVVVLGLNQRDGDIGFVVEDVVSALALAPPSS